MATSAGNIRVLQEKASGVTKKQLYKAEKEYDSLRLVERQLDIQISDTYKVKPVDKKWLDSIRNAH